MYFVVLIIVFYNLVSPKNPSNIIMLVFLRFLIFYKREACRNILPLQTKVVLYNNLTVRLFVQRTDFFLIVLLNVTFVGYNIIDMSFVWIFV